MEYTVRLKDGTVGTVVDDGEFYNVGDNALVFLHDENGNDLQVSGEIVEILN